MKGVTSAGVSYAYEVFEEEDPTALRMSPEDPAAGAAAASSRGPVAKVASGYDDAIDAPSDSAAAQAGAVRVGGYDAIDNTDGSVQHAGVASAGAGDPVPSAPKADPSSGPSAHSSAPRAVGESQGREGFNEKWQRVIDRDVTTPAEQLAQAVDMHKLAVSFTDRARFLAELIAAERTMYEDQRSIRALNVGGVAGGDKHLVGSVFIKYAVDSDGLYGGDAPAQKSAAHELKGLRAIRTAVARSQRA